MTGDKFSDTQDEFVDTQDKRHRLSFQKSLIKFPNPTSTDSSCKIKANINIMIHDNKLRGRRIRITLDMW